MPAKESEPFHRRNSGKFSALKTLALSDAKLSQTHPELRAVGAVEFSEQRYVAPRKLIALVKAALSFPDDRFKKILSSEGETAAWSNLESRVSRAMLGKDSMGTAFMIFCPPTDIQVKMLRANLSIYTKLQRQPALLECLIERCTTPKSIFISLPECKDANRALSVLQHEEMHVLLAGISKTDAIKFQNARDLILKEADKISPNAIFYPSLLAELQRDGFDIRSLSSLLMGFHTDIGTNVDEFWAKIADNGPEKLSMRTSSHLVGSALVEIAFNVVVERLCSTNRASDLKTINAPLPVLLRISKQAKENARLDIDALSRLGI